MDNGSELPHLIFRWLHVVAAVMWIGQLWSLALVYRLTPGRPVDAGVGRAALRAHNWLRWSGTATWLTGLPLLGIVYYGGGALTGVGQSFGLAAGVGLAALFTAFVVYDAVWMLLARHEAAAALLSLALFTGAAAALQRVMTGRAMFIHLGAMLGTIMLANVWRRVWPIESRRLAAQSAREPSSIDHVRVAAVRLQHNALLAVAVILFMVSNHFPLVYGQSRAWLLAPGIVAVGWFVITLCEVLNHDATDSPVPAR